MTGAKDYIASGWVEVDIDVWILHAHDLLLLENLVGHSGIERGAQLEKLPLSRFGFNHSDYIA